MPRGLFNIPEVTLQDGARLFVAAYPIADSPIRGAHRYTFYGLSWLRGGAATLNCDGKRLEIAPGSLVCTAPGQVTWWERPEPDTHITLLGFIPEVFTGGALDVRLVTDLPCFTPDGSTVISATPEVGTALDTLFQQVWERYTQSAAHDPNRSWLSLPRGREGLLLAYLHAILAEAATLEMDASVPLLTQTQNADLRLSRLFRLHIAESALQRHPVSYYAELLNITADHLARVVRRATGKTPEAWLQERVLLEAKRLLTFTSQPVERIAEELNFPTATQFSQWFRTRSGQTPRDFRQGAGRVSERTSDFRQL